MTTSDTAASVLSAPDLSDPYYTIEHLAQALGLEVDSAREYTYRDDFPQPIKIGRRWIWFPEELALWARKQPRFSVAQRKRNPVAAPAAPTTRSSYKRRTATSGTTEVAA